MMKNIKYTFIFGVLLGCIPVFLEATLKPPASLKVIWDRLVDGVSDGVYEQGKKMASPNMEQKPHTVTVDSIGHFNAEVRTTTLNNSIHKSAEGRLIVSYKKAITQYKEQYYQEAFELFEGELSDYIEPTFMIGVMYCQGLYVGQHSDNANRYFNKVGSPCKCSDVGTVSCY
jgi:hypothetical protein